jgi:hypothetical protein
MYGHLLEALASQRIAEYRADAAARAHRRTGSGPQGPSLRVRAGWTLIGVGLRLVVQPHGRAAASPRPAGV